MQQLEKEHAVIPESLPWALYHGHDDSLTIEAVDGTLTTWHGGVHSARYMVQAVNNHAALVEALEALTEHSSGTNTAFFVKGTSKAMHAAMQGQKALLDAARAALAQAEGQP